MILFKTLVFTILAPGGVTILLPWLLLRHHLHWPALPDLTHRYLATLLVLPGYLVYLRCALDFAFTGRGTPAPVDPPKVLVVKGLYRWVRNPMYMGMIAVLAGEAAFFWSPRMALYAGVCWLLFHLFVVLYEERTLLRRFGGDYAAYCRRVNRWLPRPPRA